MPGTLGPEVVGGSTALIRATNGAKMKVSVLVGIQCFLFGPRDDPYAP